MYLKEEKLVRSLQEINAKLKEEARKPSPISMDLPESYLKPYSNLPPRVKTLSLEEEVKSLIEKSRTGDILKLEPEEMERDEVMQVVDEEDD